MKNIDTLEEILIDKADQHFPKGDKARGQAMVLIGELLPALNLYIEGKIREELQTMQIIDFDGEDGSMTLDEYLENRIKELEG